MANDITTLAIALQSREAEANLKTFNELLTEGSDKAKRMERMTIGVDVDAAVQQLNTLRASYEEIAKQLNIPLGTVKIQLRRARLLLAEIIKSQKHSL